MEPTVEITEVVIDTEEDLPSVELSPVSEEEEEEVLDEVYTPIPTEEAPQDDVEAAVAAVEQKSKRKRRRFFRRGRARVAAASWWTECKNIETTGCSFAIGYICLSFVLMTLMFNMREIVGDYCLGTKETQEEEYRENLEKAMELRRRNPYDADEANRFEKELAADLYYDKQGQTAEDSEYFLNHRVPIILREDLDEFEDKDEGDDP